MKQLVTNPSEMNEPIEVYGVVEDITEDGVPITIEKKLFTTWAKVMTHLLNEFSGEAGTELEDKTTFVIRYDQPILINATMKIHWNNQVFEVVKILRDNAYKQYDSMVSRLVN